MLVNQNFKGLRALRTDIPEMLAAMNNSSIEFHLTGSRGWPNQLHAGVNIMTDWDFFADNNHKTLDFLFENGFEQEFNNPYEGDPNSASVWRYDGIPSIHVQAVRNVGLKLEVESMIRKYLPMTFYKLTKDQRKSVWKLMYATHEIGHKSAMPAINVPEVDEDYLP